MKPNAIALIAARAGSKRLPGKALLLFGNSTLIGHKVQTLLACENIKRVIVGSDSPEILLEASKAGAETIRRDDYHCDESRCTANEMIFDFASKIEEPDENTPVLWAHCTNPLVRPETYDSAIEHFCKSQNDSLLSVTKVQRHCWYQDRPLNYYPWTRTHIPAAGVIPLYFQDGAIFIQTLGRFKETSYFFGETPSLFLVDEDEGTDIDTQADYEKAVRLLQQRERRDDWEWVYAG